MKTPKTRKESSTLETQPKGRDLLDELNTALKEIKRQNSEKLKRANELKIANKELVYQTSEKADRASELLAANKELAFQSSEKKNRADELEIANKELIYQKSEKANRASELLDANKELAFQTKEKKNRADELELANKELQYQKSEKANRADELEIANKELVYQTSEKADRASELVLANEELVYQQSEKSKREDELAIANKELAYQTSEKADRASELIIVKQTMMGQEVEIENLNYRNELPGLFNRKYFLDALKKYDLESNLPISIIMGDLNGLAIIDDSLGHSIVEDIQTKLNKILKKVARKADIIICFSNGEFALILPKTTIEQASQVVEKLKMMSEQEKAGPLSISVSCGNSTKSSPNIDINVTVNEAVEKLNKDRKIVSHAFENHTIDLIMEMLFEKNNREMLHSSRVSEICEKIAFALKFDPGVVDRIRITGMLHDIGKIGIDERILNKADKLDAFEWAEIKKHTQVGHRILSASNDFRIHAQDVLEHHERIDGSGYPEGLKGDEISIVARIIAIADTYDAITSDRPYRKALSRQAAITEIQRCAGTQFDPEIVKVFVALMEENAL